MIKIIGKIILKAFLILLVNIFRIIFCKDRLFTHPTQSQKLGILKKAGTVLYWNSSC